MFLTGLSYRLLENNSSICCCVFFIYKSILFDDFSFFFFNPECYSCKVKHVLLMSVDYVVGHLFFFFLSFLFSDNLNCNLITEFLVSVSSFVGVFTVQSCGHLFHFTDPRVIGCHHRPMNRLYAA